MDRREKEREDGGDVPEAESGRTAERNRRWDVFDVYRESQARYYRFVVRKDDEEVLRRIQKIPDSWEEYDRTDAARDLVISDFQRKRLSDIKNRKSWEIRFESLYVYYLVVIEETLIDCLCCRPLPGERLQEAVDAASMVGVEIGSRMVNFKHLLLSLAKRSVSDLYYLMISYIRYYQKKDYDFSVDFAGFCRDAVHLFEENRRLRDQIDEIISLNRIFSGFFHKSSSVLGIRLDEFALKAALEKQEEKGFPAEEQIIRVVTVAYLLKKKLKKDYEFLLFYHNGQDGKLYRYQFITQSFLNKLNEGKIDRDSFNGFEEVMQRFVELKQSLEGSGLDGFGPDELSYFDLLEFALKGCRILEFLYLRGGRHEKLQNLRNQIFHYVELEYRQMRELVRKYSELE